MTDHVKLKEKIIKKAETDAKFREELKKDPKAAIEKHFPQADGKKIPANLNIVVTEESENTVYLNIAPNDLKRGEY